MRAAIGYLCTVVFTVGFIKWAIQDAASALPDPTSLFHIAMEPLGATIIFLLVCIVYLLVCSTWRKMSETGKLHPGPFPLPLIGNMLQLENNLPEASRYNLKAVFFLSKLFQLRKKYNPMFTECLGSVHAVVYGLYVVKYLWLID